MPRTPAAPPAANSATMRAFVHLIRSAAPYVHAFRGKTFVIAFGGEVVADDEFLGVIHDLNLLHSLGIRLVVAHGCRPQVEAILAAQGIPSRYAHGVRVTDADAMDCVLEAAGQVRARIEALLSLGLANSPMAGARNRVSSGNYLTAKPMGVVDGIDMQLTGEVRRIDTEAIQQRLDDGDIVLISPDRLFAHRRDLQSHRRGSRDPGRGSAGGGEAHLPDGCRRRAQWPAPTPDRPFDHRRRGTRRQGQADARRPVVPARRHPRVQQRRQARAPHLPAAGRRAAARALHARRRRHDGLGDRAREHPQRHDRRRRRHPGDHRAAGGARRAGAPLARAAGERNRALRRRRVRWQHHRLRGAVRVSRGEDRRARSAGRAAGLPARRLRRGVACARSRCARASSSSTSSSC